MAQGVFPFKYENEKTNTGMTALAGLPPYLYYMIASISKLPANLHA